MRREGFIMGGYHEREPGRAQGLASTIAVLILCVSTQAAHPPSLGGQSTETRPTITMSPVAPSVAGRGASGPLYERRVALVQEALVAGVSATSRDDSLAAFILAVDTAGALVRAAPGDADAHYLHAVALGQRLGLTGIREKVRLGAATRAEAETALELDPDHAGAHHVLGRLHAGTMRMNPVSRFLAKRVLGAEALEGASWDLAEYHFLRAHQLEPDNPRYALELGVLYMDTDRPDAAVEVLRLAAEAPRETPIDDQLAERAIRLIGSIEGS